MTATNTVTALRLKSGTANKVGQRSSGLIAYETITDDARQTLWIRIVANPSSGYFSREMVDFRKVEACIEGFRDGKPVPSKAFAVAFSGRSANNGGFLAAILRAEGLLSPAPDNNFHHLVCGDWQVWRTSNLQLSGEEIDIAPSNKTAGRARPVERETSTETPKLERKERKKRCSDKTPGEEVRHAGDS